VEDIDAEKLHDAVRDAQISCLTQLRKNGASVERYNSLADQLLSKHLKHLPLLLERLEFAYGHSKDDGSATEAEARMKLVVAAADALVATLELNVIAQYFGVQHDPENLAVKKETKEMEGRRHALRLALLRKAAVLADAVSADGASEDAKSSMMKAVEELRRWVPSPDAVKEEERDLLALTLSCYEACRNRIGAALEVLRKRLALRVSDSAKRQQLLRESCKLYRRLGWDHWALNTEELMHRDCPVALPPL